MDEKPQTDAFENWAVGEHEDKSVAGVTFGPWQEMEHNLPPEEPHVLSVKTFLVLDQVGEIFKEYERVEALLGQDEKKLLELQRELGAHGKRIDLVVSLEGTENKRWLKIRDVRSEEPVPVIELTGKSYLLTATELLSGWHLTLDPGNRGLVAERGLPNKKEGQPIDMNMRYILVGQLHR